MKILENTNITSLGIATLTPKCRHEFPAQVVFTAFHYRNTGCRLAIFVA